MNLVLPSKIKPNVKFYFNFAVTFLSIYSTLAHAVTTEPTISSYENKTYTDYDTAVKNMAPLQVGESIGEYTRPDGTVLEKVGVTYQGVSVVNLGLKVLTNKGTRTNVLETFTLPEQFPDTKPAISEADAIIAMQSRYPFYTSVKSDLVLIAIADPKSTDELQIVSELKLVWRLLLAPTDSGRNNFRVERVLGVDAQKGDIFADLSAFDNAYAHDPAQVVGRGYYAGEQILLGTYADQTYTQICLRDPNYSSAPYNPCDTTAIYTGVATYLYEDNTNFSYFAAPAVRFANQGGFGNGQPPQDPTDTLGLESTAVDSFYYTSKILEFYRHVFSRNSVGSIRTNSVVSLLPYDTERDQAGRYIHGAGAANAVTSEIHFSPRTDPQTENPFAHPQSIAHEYSHLLLEYETQVKHFLAGGATFSTLGYREYLAINEGIADVWGVLIEATLAGPPWGAPIKGPEGRWVVGAKIFTSPEDLKHRRYFDNPREQRSAVEAYGETSDMGISFHNLDQHEAGGVIRQWFYYLANGYAPTTAANAEYSSRYYTRGMTGIGVYPAAVVLYRAITEGLPFLTVPNFFTLQSSMLRMLAADGCSTNYKAAKDAWAAVNIGTGADYYAPVIRATINQELTGVVISAEVEDQGDGLPINGKYAKIIVDGSWVTNVPLAFIGTNDDVNSYSGNIVLNPNLFAGTTPHNVSLVVKDWCGYETTYAFNPFTADNVLPKINEAKDVTSINWSGTTQPPANPMSLSTTDRKMYVKARDDSKLLSLTFEVGGRLQTLPLDSGLTDPTLYDGVSTISFSHPATPAGGTYAFDIKVTDRYGNVRTKTLPNYVIDRTPPQRCEIGECTQDIGSKHIYCSVHANDSESGIFATRVRTIGSSPEIFNFGQTGTSPTNSVYQGWLWRYFDSSLPGSEYTTSHTSRWVNEPPEPGKPNLTDGTYTIVAECRDFWGNVSTSPQKVVTISDPPIVTLGNPVFSANHNSYTITATATDSTGGMRLLRTSSTINGTSQNDLVITNCSGSSCSYTHSGAPGAGRTVTVSARGQDIYGVAGQISKTFTLPAPTPPPTTLSEVEENDRWQNANVVSSQFTEVTGDFVTGDNDHTGCKANGQEYLAAINNGFSTYQLSSCGDYFMVTLPRNSQVSVAIEYTGSNASCAVHGVTQQSVAGTPLPLVFENNITYSGSPLTWTRVTNNYTSPMALYFEIFSRNNAQGLNVCQAGVHVPYKFHIRR